MLKTNKTRMQKKTENMKSDCVFLIYLLLSDYHETCTDYVKHKNIEIFFLEIFQFNGLLLRYVKKE